MASPAQIEANRANAKRSTGPRTAAGKARSASNSFRHGFFSLQNFENFTIDNNHALAVVDNLLLEYAPVTPTENILVHELIHFQLRFLQMEALYNHAMDRPIGDIIATPPLFLNAILRELERLPTRIAKAIKAIGAQQLLRDDQTELEPIDDLPQLPDHDKSSPTPAAPTDPDDVEKSKRCSQLLYARFGARVTEKYGPPIPTPDLRNEANHVDQAIFTSPLPDAPSASSHT